MIDRILFFWGVILGSVERALFHMALAAAIIALSVAVIGGLVDPAKSASNTPQFTYSYWIVGWVSEDPDQAIVGTSLEPMHVMKVVGTVSIPAPGTLGLYSVPAGTPCRNTSNKPNGVRIFDDNVAFDTSKIGTQQLALTKKSGDTALMQNFSLCVIDETQVHPDSRATMTIGLGP
jgi:hypothetical protein